MAKNAFGYIYSITNKISGKKYIGQTIQEVEERWKEHKYSSTKEENKTVLYNAIRSYGIDSFEFSVVCEASSREDINNLESFYIKEWDTLSPNGYNLTSGGHHYVHNPATLKKISDSLKGHEAWNKGIPHSEETKKKLSLAKKGYVWSEEAIASRSKGIQAFYDKLRESVEKYENHIKPFRERATAHLHTPEVEAKASQNKIGTHPVYSEERNTKISKTLKELGHKPSEECNEKARDARIGSHHTEETKQKISEAKKGQEAHNKILLTQEQEDLIRYLYKQKESISDIGRAIGGETPISKTAMTRILKDLGVYEQRTNKAFLDEDTFKVAKLMLSQGASILGIKKALDLSMDPKTLKNLLSNG